MHLNTFLQKINLRNRSPLRRIFAGLFMLGMVLPNVVHAASVTLKAASLAPQGSAWGKLLETMAQELEKKTEGRVKLKLYLGGKLGDEATVAKKLGRGLHGAFFTGQGMGILLPAFRVQELPFLSENYAEADKVRKTLWPMFEDEFEKKTKFVLLGPGETGMVYLFSKKPITSVNELKASKLWVWEGDSVASDTFKVFGVSPRPLDILTVVQQLKSGGIDTVYNSPAGAVALGWTGSLGHISARNFAYASGGFVLTKEAWAEIPQADRAIIRQIVNEYGEKMIAQSRKDNDASFQRLTSAGGGLKPVAIPEKDYAEMKKVGQNSWNNLAAHLGATNYLKEARKVLSK